jgi:hypothetical protein
MRYRLSQLKIFGTPKAEKMFDFEGLPEVEFDFPTKINVALAISCGFVRASARGDVDFYEVVFRLYEGANPQEIGENHVGKLYVHVHGHPFNTTFKTTVERFEWYEDGSFDVITANGERHHITPPESKF